MDRKAIEVSAAGFTKKLWALKNTKAIDLALKFANEYQNAGKGFVMSGSKFWLQDAATGKKCPDTTLMLSQPGGKFKFVFQAGAGGRGRGGGTTKAVASAGRGAGGGTSVGQTVGRNKKGTAAKITQDSKDRLSCYNLDISDLRFDVNDAFNDKSSKAEEGSATQYLTLRKKVDKVDASMFGDFTIHVNSEAKEGTELGFEFKAILDKDFEAFSADDFDISFNATDIALSGVAICAECDKTIKDKKIGVSVFGKAYHRHHLSCAQCKENFMNGGEALEGEDGQAYCKKDWEARFLKKCSGCVKLIHEKKPLYAMKRFWHKACFNCQTCKNPIEGRYYEEGGAPMCADDYYKKKGLVCPACEKYVEGEPLTIGKFKFHKSHYKCNFCRQPPSGFFKKVDRKPGRIYCTDCHARIYEA